MTVSVKAPTSTTGSIQLNGSDVININSSGNVGIGTSSPSVKLHVKDSTYSYLRLDGSIDHGGIVQFQGADDVINARIMSYSTTSGSAKNNLMFYTNTSTNSGIVERMRIDYNGNLLVGVTSGGSILYGASIENTLSSGARTKLTIGHTVGGTGNDYIVFRYDGTNIGSITQNGTTNVAYNTNSDYRLKENVAPMSGSIDRLKQLKPSTWSWVQDGSHGEGFIAHEAQSVVPEAVTGTKDAVDDEGNPVYQGIDQSKLVPLLTAALQEAITKIEDLETRIQALENPS